MSTVCTMQVIGQQLNPTDPGLLAKESSKDPVIATVMCYIKEGCPHMMNSKDVLHSRSWRTLSVQGSDVYISIHGLSYRPN